jgi:uncharacterized membrane protein YtjA (UPF0391 family)
MLTLFPDEQKLMEFTDGSVTLTTHRIYLEQPEGQGSYTQSIMLDHISSCENHYHAATWLLVVSALLAGIGFIGLASNSSEQSNMAFPIALLCLVVYMITRKSVVIIGSPSTKMIIKTAGMKRADVRAFINKVEQAKYKYDLAARNTA